LGKQPSFPSSAVYPFWQKGGGKHWNAIRGLIDRGKVGG